MGMLEKDIQENPSPLSFLAEKQELCLKEPVEGWEEKTVFTNRCAKVVKGGRRFRFSVLVVAGNKAGLVGYGIGKAKEVTDAVRKASENAKKHVYKIPLWNNTIPHVALGVFDGARVVLKPACHGTGVIAGGAVRAVLEAAGVKDILSKSLKSNNNINAVCATIRALMQMRTKQQICALRAAKADVA